MAYVPAGGDFDEDGFDFGDEDAQETVSSSNCFPEPTLAQVSWKINTSKDAFIDC